jgi:uncharacterized protein (DUF2236 family)
VDVLRDYQAARNVLDIAQIAKPPLIRWMPDSMWHLVRVPLTRFLTWVTTGLLPEPVRRRLDLRWSRGDALLLRLFSNLIAVLFPVVPFDLRYHPRARDGWRRARGATTPDAPLVHSPTRNLPRPERRSHPGHYVQTRSARTLRAGRAHR